MEHKCLLERPGGEGPNCRANVCHRCGWNPEVLEKRNQILREKGLTMGEDGIERLILPPSKPKEEEEPQGLAYTARAAGGNAYAAR